MLEDNFEDLKDSAKPKKGFSWIKGIFFAVVLSITVSMPLAIHQLPDIIKAFNSIECKGAV
jgi:hypothetical protein